MKSFKEQAIALEAGGADALVVETMSDSTKPKQPLKHAAKHTV
jgi:methionine synthase I (cobalamin-dependent)